MTHVKIGPKHQITIPKQVFEELQLEVGDLLEVSIENGKVVITPKRIMDKLPAPKLSLPEQQLLEAAKKKIEAIRQDLKTARGLTEEEIAVALKVGLIDADQQWWWTEEWQRGEREAQAGIESGQVEEFASPEAFLNSLRS